MDGPRPRPTPPTQGPGNEHPTCRSILVRLTRTARTWRFATAILSALCLLLVSVAPAGAAGLQGSSVLALDGIDDYAGGPDGAAYDVGTGATDDFTLEMHFYISDLSAAQTGTLFHKNLAYSVYILFNVSGDQDRIIYRLYTGSTSYVYTFHNVTLADGWHHLAAVFDNEYTESSDLSAIYLDGALVTSGTGVDWTPGLPNTSSPFYLGGYAGINSFPGRLEDARISNTVRYSGASYTVPTAPFAADAFTVALWHFDEAPVTTAFADSSGHGNGLTGYNGAATYNDDMTPPTAPTLDQPTTPTNQTTVWLTGTAEASSTVLLYDGAGLLGTTTASSGGSFTYQATLSEGGHVLTAKARDAAGNTSSASQARNVTVDLTAPTVVDDAQPGWVKTALTVTLTPQDGGGSGIAKSQYRRVGSPTWLDTSAHSFVVSGAGIHQYQYRALDHAGNASATGSVMVRIDLTAPTTTASRSPAANAAGWSNAPVTVTFAGSDAHSGIASTQYSVNNGSTWTKGGSAVVSANGTTVLRYRSLDHAGNLETASSLTLRIDSRKPATKAFKATVKKGRKVKLGYRVDDPVPGCGQATVTLKIYKGKKLKKTIRIKAVCACNVKQAQSWKCTLAKGRYTVKAFATDIAGNPQSKVGSARLTVK